MNGAAIATRVKWDSEFFGLPVARVTETCVTGEQARQVVSWASHHRIRCVYCLLQSSDRTSQEAVRRVGFRLVDVRVQLTQNQPYTSRESAPVEPVYDVGPHRPGEAAALGRLARETHDNTRFFLDPNFPRERSAALYERWIRDSCDGAADVVLVARRQNEPVGYASCHVLTGGSGTIGLLGVAREARGCGAGHALVRSALGWFRGRRIGPVVTVTQGRNTAALQLYRRNGFEVSCEAHWWHLWLPQDSRHGIA